MVFSGLHSMEQDVYFLPEPAIAIAILVSQKVTREMLVTCSGQEPIRSLQKAMDRISSVRIVSCEEEFKRFIYHGVWIITAIDHQPGDQAVLTMYNMPG